MKAPALGYGSDRCDDATKAKIAEAQAWDKGHNWRGDAVGYSGIHKRARKLLPMRCSHADASCSGHHEVALRHDAAGPLRTDKRGDYSPNVDDYFILCRSHHNRYDGKQPPVGTRFGYAVAGS